MTIKIANKTIGSNNPVFIIAEIGSNYNQDFKTAKKMINEIKNVGADAVKFQIFQDKKLYPKNAGQVDYLKKDISINELVKKAEVTDEMHYQLFEYCKSINLIYLCTPTDEEKADYLESLGVPAYKIASYDLTNHYLLKHIAKKNKPIIISTGAGYFSEISEALNIILEAGNKDIILMQCVAQYPAKYSYTNLKTMETFKKAFGIPVGISDHSADPYIVPFAATALGAEVIEKHFTLDRNQDGPDHAFAIEADEFKKMVDGIKKVEQAMGTGIKTITKGEEELRRFAFRSVFAIKDIEKGEKITLENCIVLRPGKRESGINAKHYELILGSIAQKKIKNNEAVQWDDILNK